MAADPRSSPQPLPQVSLDILQIVKTSQAQNGLRHGDYQRYRQYCTRRLRRLRTSLKYTQGRGRYHKKVLEPDAIADSRHLLLPLTVTERAWAHAMQLKQQTGTSVASEPRRRFHLTRRLAKAARLADEFEDMCSKRADARTALEAEAYTTTMKANMLLEREEWKSALTRFVRARTIYDQLSRVGDAAQQRLYQQRVDEIDPSIRYCNYNVKKSGGQVDEDFDKAAPMDVDTDLLTAQNNANEILRLKLEGVVEESRRKQAEQMRTVEYRDLTLPVRNDKVRVCLVSAHDLEAELKREDKSEKWLAQYDAIFIQLEDARKHIRNDLLALAAAADKKSTEGAGAPELNTLLTYVSELLLRKTIDRNLLLVEEQLRKVAKAESGGLGKKIVRPDDLIRLYEILIQNMKDLGELAGQDKQSAVQHEISTKVLVWRAFRCLYLGESYAGTEKWAEAVALYDRAKQLAASALSNLATLSPPEPDLTEKVEKLIGQVRAQRCLAHAHAVLKTDAALKGAPIDSMNITDGVTEIPSKGLLARLDAYDLPPGELVLSEFPPQLQPVGCKPLLFDLAYSSVQYPSLAHRVGKSKKGWFSWLKQK